MRTNTILPILAMWLLLGTSIATAANTFIISGNPFSPPVVWEEYQGLSGVAPDLVAEIMDELSLPYDVRVIPDWEKVQDEARAGNIDLVVAAYRNQEREQYLNFSTAFLPQPSVIVVKKGNEFPFKEWSALKGKNGVAGVGESFGQDFDSYIADNLDVSYFQIERAIKELTLGEADYLIIDFYTALVYTYLLQGENAVTVLKPSIGTENFHLAIPRSSALNDHLDDINRVLEEKIAGGVVTELFMKHYDKWRKVIERQSEFFNKFSEHQSESQQRYLEVQGDQARDQILRLMVDREGVPAAAQ